MVSLTRAIELVKKLGRTRHFPQDDAGLECLARGLQNAEQKTKIGAGRIIERCATTSEWCPTDAELLTIAKDLAREDGVVAGTFDVTLGAGNAISRAPRCPQCDGTGFEIIYTIHTKRTQGDWKYADRQNITAEVARAIEKAANWPNDTQRIYSGARRCTECLPGATA